MRTGHQASKPSETAAPRVIEIELLALDLTSCTRCVGTLDNIGTAIDTVRPVLEATGARVNVRRLVVESEEQARQYRFVTSPTIRINGKDIVFDTLESKCDSCTDLCGCDEGTECRVWRYQGKEYTEAPVGLVVEALLHEISGGDAAAGGATSVSEEVPENLRRFFTSKSAKESAGSQSCCPSTDQATCCAPHEKTACCGTSESGTCGCR